MHQYRFKRSFSEDATLSSRLFNLLESTFAGISRTAESARALNAPWEEASTPFVCFEGDLAIAHVGVLELPMVVMGQSMIVGGIHAVCTRPEFRRRGYFRDCMQEALDYCDRRYDTLVLTTSQPQLYEPFGFRVVKEHAFVAKCASTGYTEGFRTLNTQDPTDQKLLHRLLSERVPVSNVVGIVNEKAVFCFNECTTPLHYAEDLDIIACIEIEDKRLKLFDLVGTHLCPLATIIERIHQPLEEVVIYFSPERLDADVQPFPHLLDGDSLLMARGPFAAKGRPFMLPRSARC